MKKPTLLLLAALAFTSCAEYPATFAVKGKYGTYSYSPKAGLVVEVDATK